MESMVEKIAGAILKHFLSGGEYVKDLGYGLIKVDQCLDLQEISRVALKAMREPTEEMVDAGVETDNDFSEAAPQKACIMIWWSMLDAALKEPVS